jgi:methylphosphotriester-DNA--protein-cysteine methyltransferase
MWSQYQTNEEMRNSLLEVDLSVRNHLKECGFDNTLSLFATVVDAHLGKLPKKYNAPSLLHSQLLKDEKEDTSYMIEVSIN